MTNCLIEKALRKLPGPPDFESWWPGMTTFFKKLSDALVFSAGYGGFNQMPGNQQFPMMMQQQQFAMMQQQGGRMPMMPQGGVPMVQQGMNPMMQQQQQQQQQQAMMMQGGQMFPGSQNQVLLLTLWRQINMHNYYF